MATEPNLNNSEPGRAPLQEPAAAQAPQTAGAQAPQTAGWSRRWLGPFHVTGVFWYRFIVFGVRILPRFLVAPVVYFWTAFFYLVLSSVRTAIQRNLDWVLGPPEHRFWGRQRRAFATLLNHAWCMTETYEGLARGRRVEVETEGAEHWHRLTSGEGGFVVITAHVGHWEVGTREAKSERARKLHVVREQEMDPVAQRFLQGLLKRQAGGGIEIHFSRPDDFALGARLLSALRRGDMVALQGDRPRAGARAATVELFGKPIDLPVGPVALARVARVPLIPVFMFRRGRGRSLLVFRPPIEVAHTKDRDGDQRAALRQIAGQVEWAIRRVPTQWFCFRDLWGKRPVI